MASVRSGNLRRLKFFQPALVPEAVSAIRFGMKITSHPPDSVPATETQVEIYHGDCVAGMARLAEKSVDLVVTSPPYNLGIKYSKYQDNQEREAYLAWCLSWGGAVKRVLKDDGALFLNIGASPSNPMLPHELAKAFADHLFTLQNTIHWIKAITIDDDANAPISRGHFKPISSPRFLNDSHEYIFHFTKDGKAPIDRLAIGVPYADKSNIARWGHTEGRDRRCRGNTWFIPYKTIRDRSAERPHPASFPPELVKNCLLLHGNASELTVLDPFLGIGNTVVAAQGLQVRRAIGFDIDEDYLQVAAEKSGSVIRPLSRPRGRSGKRSVVGDDFIT
jgi:site-specific DNA-methyltransferase (adenine-specific)